MLLDGCKYNTIPMQIAKVLNVRAKYMLKTTSPWLKSQRCGTSSHPPCGKLTVEYSLAPNKRGYIRRGFSIFAKNAQANGLLIVGGGGVNVQ